MNRKNLKGLRKHARTSLKSSKMKGPFEREEYMRQAGAAVAATQKQVKRSIRVVSKKFRQKPPSWAQRLEFLKKLVMGKDPVTKKSTWKNVGLFPV